MGNGLVLESLVVKIATANFYPPLNLPLQRMDRKWSVVGTASVEYTCHETRCGEFTGGIGQEIAAAAGQGDWHLSSETRTLFTVLR